MPAIHRSPRVQQAQESGNGVVALESTVIAHGLPHPRNLEVARSLEEEVSGYGAVPATVGVVRGKAIVGLAPDEIARLGTAAGVLKLSTRDLPVALARGLDGATTVASTMWLAHHAGVAVFATGGIGGVHRGDGTDVSADITELGRTPMIVVCAGAKAILDLAATREALETAGVLVVGFGTDELPGFYSRESGLPVDVRADTPDDVAALWQAHRKLGAPGSLLLCAPPPADTALPAHAVEGAIRQALAQADARGIRGKEVTPFLLSAVAEQTGGKSLEANVALLRNNARIAAQVATALAQARWER
jgi:pseudouridine-5'-phosphate glycosidase